LGFIRVRLDYGSALSGCRELRRLKPWRGV
jgi:hypothetical protein